MTKRTIAREWILVLTSIIIGFFSTWGLFYDSSHKWSYATPKPAWKRYADIVEPSAKSSILQDADAAPSKVFTNDLGLLIEHMTSRVYWKQVWLSILFPYLIIQILRSIVWSIRILRSKQ